MVSVMKYLSNVFVSSIPSDLSVEVLFQCIDNESMLVKCFELFEGTKPVTVLGDSDASAIGIKCIFFLQIYIYIHTVFNAAIQNG